VNNSFGLFYDFLNSLFFSRLNLFSYMSAEFIIEQLTLVCKPLRRFILSSQSYWKYRYERRVRAPYRSIPNTKRTWLNVCHDLERMGHEWEQCAEQHHNILSISSAHIGPIIDTILLEVYFRIHCFPFLR